MKVKREWTADANGDIRDSYGASLSAVVRADVNNTVSIVIGHVRQNIGPKTAKKLAVFLYEYYLENKGRDH